MMGNGKFTDPGPKCGFTYTWKLWRPWISLFPSMLGWFPGESICFFFVSPLIREGGLRPQSWRVTSSAGFCFHLQISTQLSRNQVNWATCAITCSNWLSKGRVTVETSTAGGSPGPGSQIPWIKVHCSSAPGVPQSKQYYKYVIESRLPPWRIWATKREQK